MLLLLLLALVGESEDSWAPFTFNEFLVKEMHYVQAGIDIPMPNSTLTFALIGFAAPHRMDRVPRLIKDRHQLQLAPAAEF